MSDIPAPTQAALDAFRFHCSASLSRFARQHTTIHEASSQLRKARNEDRTATLRTSYGFLVGIFDGHYDDRLSQYASAHLLNDVDRRVSHSLEDQNGVPTCIRDAIMDFDKGLTARAEALMREVAPSKPFADWDEDDVYWCLTVDGKKALGLDDPYPVVRRPCVGSCALVCVVIFGNDGHDHKMWVAALGDSEGFLGSANRAVVPVNELHNISNPEEIERVIREHPGEEDIWGPHAWKCTKGQLQITRALGDAILKVPTDFAHALSIMWGAPVFPEVVSKWSEPGYRHTPPYISSTPSIRAFSIHKGDVLILASDGLRFLLEEKKVSSDAKVIGEATFTLAGLKDSEQQKDLERSLGHPFVSADQYQNLAELVIRNALFGEDEKLLAREMDKSVDIYRDDVSVIVVQFS